MLKKIWDAVYYRSWSIICNETEAEMLGLWFIMVDVKIDDQYEVVSGMSTDEQRFYYGIRIGLVERLMYYMDFVETRKETWVRIGSWL